MSPSTFDLAPLGGGTVLAILFGALVVFCVVLAACRVLVEDGHAVSGLLVGVVGSTMLGAAVVVFSIMLHDTENARTDAAVAELEDVYGITVVDVAETHPTDGIVFTATIGSDTALCDVVVRTQVTVVCDGAALEPLG